MNIGSIADSRLKELHPMMPVMYIKAVTQVNITNSYLFKSGSQQVILRTLFNAAMPSAYYKCKDGFTFTLSSEICKVIDFRQSFFNQRDGCLTCIALINTENIYIRYIKALEAITAWEQIPSNAMFV